VVFLGTVDPDRSTRSSRPFRSGHTVIDTEGIVSIAAQGGENLGGIFLLLHICFSRL
jgi:hypothetical protein